MQKIHFLYKRHIYIGIIGFLFFYHCQSATEFIKRPTPDMSFARARVGDVVYSSTDFKFENDRQRLVYKYWKFAKSDSKSITLDYEEHLDFIKLKPDFKEERTYEFDKNFSIRIQGMILEIYELSKDKMVYYMKSGG